MTYINDIFIMKKIKKKHRERTWRILKKLLKTELKIKFFKSEFKKEEVKFLRYIIERESIRSDSKKIKVLKEWPRSTKIKKVQSLIDFVNYYRKLILGLSKITYPLNQLLKKEKKWKWEKRKKENFQQIIRNISKENKIRIHNPELSLTIETDASDYITEAVLLQEGELITFMSKTMNQTE